MSHSRYVVSTSAPSSHIACARITKVNPAPLGKRNKYELEVSMVCGRFKLGPAVLHLSDGGEEVVSILGSWHSADATHPSARILTWFGIEAHGSFDVYQSQYLTQAES
jgi:hypothetical protein